MQKTLIAGFLCALSATAWGATYGELAERYAQQRQAAYAPPGGGYRPVAAPLAGYPQAAPMPAYGGGYHAPGMAVPTQAAPNFNTLSMLPLGANGFPPPRHIRWSYGQVNASSDPFNTWGLSAPGMFVPWSTPMSAWTNAQTWDWWRNRAGDDGPAPPLW